MPEPPLQPQNRLDPGEITQNAAAAFVLLQLEYDRTVRMIVLCR